MVVGSYLNSHARVQGLLEVERGGNWSGVSQQAIGSDLPGNAAVEIPTSGQPFLAVALDSVSCTAGGQCVAAGTYTDDSTERHQQGLLVTGDETDEWSRGRSPGPRRRSRRRRDNPRGVAVLDLMSIAGACDAVGSYDVAQTQQGLLLTDTGGSSQTGSTAQLPGRRTRSRARRCPRCRAPRRETATRWGLQRHAHEPQGLM